MDDGKIERFKALTEADPTNELGFFSLGRAYIDAGQPAEAIPALQRVLVLNPGFSKAYALLGSAQKATGDEKGAVATLTNGYRVAHEKGDLMPRNDMAMLLKEMGAAVPEIKVEELSAEDSSSGKIKCTRCGRIAPKMPERPCWGGVGGQIHNSVCGACFRVWIGQGTKVINELRVESDGKSEL